MNKRPESWNPSYLSEDHNDFCIENNFYRYSSAPTAPNGGNINEGFQQTSDGYQIYKGRESVPVTHSPLPLGDNTIVMPSEVLSQRISCNYSTGIPADEIELQSFGRRMSDSRSVKDNVENQQRKSYYVQSVHADTNGIGKNVEESENSSIGAIKIESDLFLQKRGNGLTLLKLITIILIVWDMASDWVVVMKFDEHTCFPNIKFNNKLLADNACGLDREKIRQVIAIFSMIGSMIGALQIINIALEILNNWGLTSLRLCHAQYDLYASLYFEEIPQAIILLLFNYSCICDIKGRSFSLMAIVSGFVSCAFRYGTSFRRIGGDRGCCNMWWRCCCCQQQQFLFDCSPQECCCKCNIPFPMFCCTLSCDNCRWTTNTWCAGWLKMLQCFCSCCSGDHTMFGVRIMNNLGLVCLLCCLIAIGTLWGLVPNDIMT